eukprot:IDg680t1
MHFTMHTCFTNNLCVKLSSLVLYAVHKFVLFAEIISCRQPLKGGAYITTPSFPFFLPFSVLLLCYFSSMSSSAPDIFMARTRIRDAIKCCASRAVLCQVLLNEAEVLSMLYLFLQMSAIPSQSDLSC